MIKVMIADDNKIALEYLKELVMWESYGFEIVALGIDGIDAWEKYKKIRPQLVILDIQMPGMTGIEVAKKIRETDKNTTIIILTSYDEFEYARSAINLSVSEYFLKQELDQNILIERLIHIKQQVEKRLHTTRYLIEEQLQSWFLNDTLEIETELMKQELNGVYSLFVIEQDSYLPVLSNKLNIYYQEVSKNDLYLNCYQYFEEAAVVVRVQKYRYVCLVKNRIVNSELLYQFKKQLNSGLNNSFSLFLLCEDKDLINCKMQYIKMESMVEEHYFFSKSIVSNYLFYSDRNENTENIAINNLEKVLKRLNKDEVLQEIDMLYLPSMKDRNFMRFSYITNHLITILQSYDGKLLDYTNGKIFTLVEPRDEVNWFTVLDIIYWIKIKYIHIVDLSAQKESYNYSKEVKKAIYYIYQNYINPDLSVDEISQQTYLGINQLNTLFKKETGDTIGKYLTNLRMKVAKDLLEEDNIKISQIDVKVGYMTAAYFSKVFKKTFGITPQEYRRKVLHEEN